MVTIGSSLPGPINATSLVTGNANGVGYNVCFYALIQGDSMCYDPLTGTLNLLGDLVVRDSSKLGNLEVSGNVISSTTQNSNIYLTPNGSGKVIISGGLEQNTTSGNVIINTSSGYYSVNTTQTNTMTSGYQTSIYTQDGDITLQTGLNIPTEYINFISTGSTSTNITTTVANGLSSGMIITISGTNSVPIIDGVYTIQSIISTTTFTVSITHPVTVAGTTGNIKQHNNIYLTASNNIFVPTNVPITFGGTQNLYSDGSNTILNTNSGNFQVNGNLVVSGTTTTLSSTVTSVSEPVFIVGGNSPVTVADNMDRGIMMNYYNGGSKLGFFGRSAVSGCFTYIPNASNTNNVFTGTPGCAVFGGLTSTSLNVQGGNISNVGTLSISTLNVSNITSASNLSITAPLSTINGNFAVTGTSTLTNFSSSGTGSLTNVQVSGSTTVAGITSTANSFFTNINSSGTASLNNATVSGALTASGSASFVNYSSSGLASLTNTSISGSTSVNSLTASGAVNLTTLNVSSNSTFANISSTGTSALSTLIVSGSSTVGNITSTSTATLNNASVSGTLTASTINSSSNINITAPTTDINGNLAVTGSTTSSGINSTTGSSTINNLTSTGSTNLSSVTTSGNTNLSPSGFTTINNLNLSGSVSGFAFSTEHISGLGGSTITPSNTINTTFISVTTSGISVGVLSLPSKDGFTKLIMIAGLVSGSSYKLSCPTGVLLDPGSGTTNSKTLTFSSSGQSISLIYNSLLASYMIVGGAGCCMS
jgi:hypothetical protein